MGSEAGRLCARRPFASSSERPARREVGVVGHQRKAMHIPQPFRRGASFSVGRGGGGPSISARLLPISDMALSPSVPLPRAARYHVLRRCSKFRRKPSRGFRDDFQGTDDGVQSLSVCRELVTIHFRRELLDHVDVLHYVAQTLGGVLRRHGRHHAECYLGAAASPSCGSPRADAVQDLV